MRHKELKPPFFPFDIPIKKKRERNAPRNYVRKRTDIRVKR